MEYLNLMAKYALFNTSLTIIVGSRQPSEFSRTTTIDDYIELLLLIFNNPKYR